MTYVNTDILNFAGLQSPNEMPRDDWNWDTVVNIAKKTTIVHADGSVSQYGIDRPNQRWITVLNQAGTLPYDRMVFPTESRWNTPEARTAMEWLRSLFVDHKVAAPYGSGEVSNYYFWLGTSAMHLAYGPGMIGGGYEDLGFDWDITVPPLGPANRGSMYTANAVQISAASRNHEAAWEWIKFIAYNEDSLSRFIQLTSRIPALASMQYLYPQLAENPPKSWHLFYETAMDPNIAPPPLDPNINRVEEVIFEGFRQIFSGQQAVDAVLEEVHRRVNGILEEAASSRYAALTTQLQASRDLGSGSIVFQSDRTGSWQIFRYDIATGAVTQLTTLGQNYYPRVSADGKKIVFESTRDGSWAVYTMNIDGSDQRRVTPLDMDVRNGTWSPDGQYIAFHARVPEGGWSIFTIKVDGTELRRLTYSGSATDAWVSWSPDGKTLVYSSNRAPHGPDYKTYIINVDGTGERQLFNHPRRSQRPVWSPDGKSIVVGSNRDGQWDIYIDRLDGTSIRVTNDARTDLEPAWSPDGTKIVFSGHLGGGDVGIWVVNADGTGLRRLDVGPGQNQHPSWAP
ncbi:MAG: extracellular solute-binding protein [Firmicutes bacterium]|nr:extracellular solute-binding protein [Bacillota bacterium]